MKKSGLQKTPEAFFTLFCVGLAGLSLAFIGSLVAAPKLLFGRSLTAIPPSMFPMIVLGLLLVLSLALLVLHFRNPPEIDDGPNGLEGWRRGAVFFGIMTLYALTMVPLGFLISSAITTALLSWMIGNRVIWQIAILSLVAPILLYLAATRLLAVSLPELNAIELFVARFFNG